MINPKAGAETTTLVNSDSALANLNQSVYTLPMPRRADPMLSAIVSAIALVIWIGSSAPQVSAAIMADNFALAPVVAGVTNAAGVNTLATAEPLEPAHAGEPANHSLWIQWAVTATGTYRISTRNSMDALGVPLDTTLAVYIGTSLDNLRLVASNDDAEFFQPYSEVLFRAYAGERFYVAVDSVGASGLGSINLTISAGGPRMAPWTAVDLSGRPFSSSDYSHRLVMVDFWETTCGTCVAELSELVRLYNNYRSRGFSIIGLSIDPNPMIVSEYLYAPSVPYLIGMSSSSAVASLGGPVGVPTKYLVDQDGLIVGRFQGGINPIEATEDYYSNILNLLLRAPPPIRLEVVKAGPDSVRISWPNVDSSLELQSSAAGSWKRVLTPVENVNGRNVVTLAMDTDSMLFRLKKP